VILGGFFHSISHGFGNGKGRFCGNRQANDFLPNKKISQRKQRERNGERKDLTVFPCKKSTKCDFFPECCRAK
jgi:hypothetical protein